jgi:ubiquitin-conjugating enzyme E2 A
MSGKSSALKRIQRDLEKVSRENDPGFVVNADDDNLFSMTALIAGPESTMWEGGFFELSLTFTEEYPIQCPSVVFKSRMFHPNIYHDGRICLDLLSTQWSPSYDVMAILVSIRSLLNCPNVHSPANNEACDIYTKNMIEYERRVQEIVALSQEEPAVVNV